MKRNGFLLSAVLQK